MVRQGANKWISNAGTPEYQAWEGDIRLSAEGKLQFVYRFEKAPSVVTVDIKLPDGSRVAFERNGSLVLPGTTIDATRQTLADGALASLRRLNLDVPSERLDLQGVSTSGSVNTHYAVELSQAEHSRLRQAIAAQPGARIVASSAEILPVVPIKGVQVPPLRENMAAKRMATERMAAEHMAVENTAGEHVYDMPMPDHTATVAYVFKGENQRWNVLIGERKIEPAKGQNALPGGFIDIAGANVELPSQTAAREVLEETGLKISNLTLLRIGDAFNRDPRNRVIDFQYGVYGNSGDLSRMSASDDLANLQVKDVEQLLATPKALAFDHHEVLQEAYRNISLILKAAGSMQ